MSFSSSESEFPVGCFHPSWVAAWSSGPAIRPCPVAVVVAERLGRLALDAELAERAARGLGVETIAVPAEARGVVLRYLLREVQAVAARRRAVDVRW